ncbi:MAG TPA: cytochrome c [Baekduia sp.]|jgi:mono/diheme cytochrome c family protein
MDSSKGRTRATIAGVVVLVVAIAVVIVVLVTHEGNDPKVAGSNAKLTSAERHGAQLFSSTCSSCHTLKASKSTGDVGPNLDYVQPTVSQITHVIATGSRSSTAQMPAGLLTGPAAADVAAYVNKVADRRNID